MSKIITQEEAQAFQSAKFEEQALGFQYRGKIINTLRYAEGYANGTYTGEKDAYEAMAPSKRNNYTFLVEIEGLNFLMGKVLGAMEEIASGSDKKIPKEYVVTLLTTIDSLLNLEHPLGKKYHQVVEQTAQIFNIELGMESPLMASRQMMQSRQQPKNEGYKY